MKMKCTCGAEMEYLGMSALGAGYDEEPEYMMQYRCPVCNKI